MPVLARKSPPASTSRRDASDGPVYFPPIPPPRRRDNNQVIEHLDDAGPKRSGFRFRAVEVTPDPRRRHAHQVQQHQIDIGTGMTQSTYSSLPPVPFAVTLNSPFMRVNQRDKASVARYTTPVPFRRFSHSRKRWRIFALNLQVSQAGMNHMRQDETERSSAPAHR